MESDPDIRSAPLDALAAAHGLGEGQTAALARYVELVHGWRLGNVTAVRDRAAIVETLLGDSLALLDVPQLRERGASGWIDLGAGAGIPGIPLAVALPDADLTLLEAAAKKCAFLEEAVVATGLQGRARVACARSEQYAAVGAPGREAHGAVLARAVAALPVLVELAAPLLREGGVLLASKTVAGLAAEGPAAREAARLCGLAAEAPVPLPASPLAGAVCAVYRKVAPTPARLPRREGMAAKRPLSA